MYNTSSGVKKNLTGSRSILCYAKVFDVHEVQNKFESPTLSPC